MGCRQSVRNSRPKSCSSLMKNPASASSTNQAGTCFYCNKELTEYQLPITLIAPCNHIYHKVCWRKWVKKSQKASLQCVRCSIVPREKISFGNFGEVQRYLNCVIYKQNQEIQVLNKRLEQSSVLIESYTVKVEKSILFKTVTGYNVKRLDNKIKQDKRVKVSDS